MKPLFEPLRHWTKSWLAKGYPKEFAVIAAIRARRHNHRYYTVSGLSQIGRAIAGEHGMGVQSGPFQGLKLPPDALREHLAPFLLGCYEFELHDTLERVIRWQPACCVDIGSKFGYYAVGMASRLKGARTIAFDTDPWARRATKKTAGLNGVTIEIFSYCDRDWLLRCLPERSFVLSDCEGFEAELFSEPLNKNAASSCFLVETHDHAVSGVSETVRAALGATHEVMEIVPRDIDIGDSTLAGLTKADTARAMMDFRPPRQRWMAAYPFGFPHGTA